MGKKTAKSAPAAKKDLADQSLDDFLDHWDDEDDSAAEPEDKSVSKKEKKKKKKDSSGEKGKQKASPVAMMKKERSGAKRKEKLAPVASEVKVQTKYIQSLKDKDPDFYEFLKENDEELLNFNESDDEDDNEEGEDVDMDESDGDEEQDSDGEKEGKVHQLPDKLEVASDESDYEEEEEGDSTSKKAGGELLWLIRKIFIVDHLTSKVPKLNSPSEILPYPFPSVIAIGNTNTYSSRGLIALCCPFFRCLKIPF